MAIARAQLVDVALTRWYHCVTRCVRRAFLLGEGDHNRKQWLQNRLEELAEIFAVAVGGFSVMNNHLHLLLRLDPEVAQSWSDDEVVRRWGRLFPPRDKSRKPIPVTEEWVQWRLSDAQWVATAAPKLELVHEVREGTTVAAGESTGQGPGNFFRGSLQERCGSR